MPLFPPPTVEVRLDGRPVLAYHRAILWHNTVMVPVSPFAVRIARIIGQTPRLLTLERHDDIVRVRVDRADGVPRFGLAGPLRAFGFAVRFDARNKILWVTSPVHRPLAFSTPYRGAQTSVRVVFTPTPVQTPRPPFTGPMRPRRTPIPLEFWATPSPHPR